MQKKDLKNLYESLLSAYGVHSKLFVIKNINRMAKIKNIFCENSI